MTYEQAECVQLLGPRVAAAGGGAAPFTGGDAAGAQVCLALVVAPLGFD